jgi:hypothetical protein
MPAGAIYKLLTLITGLFYLIFYFPAFCANLLSIFDDKQTEHKISKCEPSEQTPR